MSEGEAGETRIRVALPFHLRALAGIETAEVTLEVAAPVTMAAGAGCAGGALPDAGGDDSRT